MPINNRLISYIIRGLQLLFSVLSLGLAAGVLGDLGGSWDRVNFVVATSALSLIYLVLVLIPQVLPHIPLIAIFLFEIFFTILWLSAFAVLADTFGSLSCSGTYSFSFGNYNYDAKWCKIGKATIPFTLFNWLLFVASLVLFVLYTLIPYNKSDSFNNFSKQTKNSLLLGGIYPNYVPAAAPPADPETGLALTDDEHKEVEQTTVPAGELEPSVVAAPEAAYHTDEHVVVDHNDEPVVISAPISEKP